MALRRLRGPSTSWSRRGAVALIATLAAVALAGTFGVRPTFAADQLRLAVTSTYRVDAAKGAVHVTMDVSATNLKPSTATRYFYYDTLSFGVQAEAKSIEATSDGRRLNVTTKALADRRDIVVHTPNVYYHQTHKTRITFDLAGGKPRSTSPIRIGRAYAAFTVWAWGDPGLADVRIVLPKKFVGNVQKWPDDTDDPLYSTSKDGQLTYRADDIAEPNRWYATVDATDRGALTDAPLDLAGEDVAIHAWPEDREWLDRVSSVLEDSVPDLETAIGQPWPVSSELGVSEVSSAQIEGYAGLYDSATDEIQISEDLDEHVIVHEAAHAWFNGGLFVQRWISEGLADEYAARIVAGNDGTGPDGPPNVSTRDAAAFRLNAWPPPSRVDDETEAAESFGYDASWMVVRTIVNEVGEPHMRDVFAAAAARTLTYAGAGPAESSSLTVVDWRRFLDLVEDVGGSTKAAGLIETWVVTDTEQPLLAARATARERYFALLDAGGAWLPGILVRKPMSSWRFSEAEAAMAEAEAVLADRDELMAATTELGLAFPTGLEPVYESAGSEADLEALDARIETWIGAAAAVRSARDALQAARAPLVTVGLFGTRPEAAYTAAVAAFVAGDDTAAVAGSSATVATLAGAEDIGRGRALTVGAAVAVVLLLLLVLVGIWLRRRRRRRGALVAAAVAFGPIFPVPEVPEPAPPMPGEPETSAAPTEPYATLAATPDRLEGDEIGVEPD